MGLKIDNQTTYRFNDDIASYFNVELDEPIRNNDYEILKKEIYKLDIDSEEKANIINNINKLSTTKSSKDNNVLIELIIYYLTLNRKYINMLSTENKTIIQDLINTQNFYIEEEKIIIYNTVISLEYLKQIVLELEEKIKPLHKGKILYFQEQYQWHPRHGRKGRCRKP